MVIMLRWDSKVGWDQLKQQVEPCALGSGDEAGCCRGEKEQRGAVSEVWTGMHMHYGRPKAELRPDSNSSRRGFEDDCRRADI